MTTYRSREIHWLKGALRDFGDFPPKTRLRAREALDIVAQGGKPDLAKPMQGLGPGVWELALKRGDAYRVVYVLQIGDELWVIHAFQKKSKSGIATPKAEIDLIGERFRKLTR